MSVHIRVCGLVRPRGHEDSDDADCERGSSRRRGPVRVRLQEHVDQVRREGARDGEGEDKADLGLAPVPTREGDEGDPRELEQQQEDALLHGHEVARGAELGHGHARAAAHQHEDDGGRVHEDGQGHEDEADHEVGDRRDRCHDTTSRAAD